MSGDYSRFTHDARKRFTSVLTQQGRVQLDSDWNEAAEIERQRLRTQALDTFGPVGVPHETTPDGFKITAPVANDFAIGQGRIYVQGMLAEIFPEETFTYQTQPFLPDPPDIGGANYNVYLDLWEREITYIEDNELLDKALGGVDTTTRIQQVWQARTQLTGGGSAVCGTPVGVPRSGGRMSVAAIAPPAPEDPCLVAPLTGYRGLENRLYRVEIHTPGGLGTATFKWSRDNGSLVTSVGEITTAAGISSIRVGRIGRDRTSRFAIGDWISVTDDHRELHGEAADLAQIDNIDEANSILILDRSIGVAPARPFAVAAADLLSRHTRVQKWDQPTSNPLVGANGTIVTSAGPIAIEDGIEVSFSTAGTEGFHVGDYWVFAARTADASVEEFSDAPPRGIVHAYVQLAAVNGPDVHDCRPQPVTSEGCCSFVVRPGEDIQQAINSLPPAGGCVCLKSGLHALRAPLVIAANNISLHGESTGAIVQIGEGPALTVSGRGHRIHELQFRRNGGGPAMITFADAQDCSLEDVALQDGREQGGIGVSIAASPLITIDRCDILGFDIGIHLAGDRARLAVVTDCNMGRLPDRDDDGQPGMAGVLFESAAGDFSRIQNCSISDVANGIVGVEDRPDLALDRLVIMDNRIECRASRNELSPRNMGIGLIADGGIIAGNDVAMQRQPEGAAVTGIAAGGLGIRIDDNDVQISEGGGPSSTGIHVGWNGEEGKQPTFHGTVQGNRVSGANVGIFAEEIVDSTVSGSAITFHRNRDEELSCGILAFRSQNCRYDENSISDLTVGIGGVGGLDNGIERNRLGHGLVGISVGEETGPILVGNVIQFYRRSGLMAFGCPLLVTAHDNRVAWIGARGDELPTTGIYILGVSGRASISRNEVANIGFDADRSPTTGVARGIVAMSVIEASVLENITRYEGGWAGMVNQRNQDGEDRALLMQGLSPPEVAERERIIGYPAVIGNNRFEGLGRTALVEFLSVPENQPHLCFERTNLTANDCMHIVRDERATTVLLQGLHALVSSNSFRATPGRPRCVNFNKVIRPIFVANHFAGPPIMPAIPQAMMDTNVQI